MPCVDVASAVALAVERDRPVDRDAVPVRDLHADAERREVDALLDRADEVTPLALLPVLLDPERDERGPARIRRREDVVRVQVAQPDEDADHLVVEASARVGLQPSIEQSQPLHRIDRVHGALEREVDVQLLDEDLRLSHDLAALVEGQILGGCEQFGQRRRLGHGPTLLLSGTQVKSDSSTKPASSARFHHSPSRASETVGGGAGVQRR